MAWRDWLQRLRGKPAPALPDDQWAAAVARLPFVAGRPADELAALRRLVEQFLAEKEFTGAHGLVLDDAMCLSIALQGCLPVLHLGLGAYGDWVGIVVYPDEFVAPRRIQDEDGVVHEFDDVLAGEAWSGGPLILSWQDTQLAGDGYNVVIHEFAHKLDMLNGEADGLPPLHSGLTVEAWDEALFAAYDDLCARVDGGAETVLDPYATESPAEFFAVSSEAFFETPDLLAGAYPAWYGMLCRYYRQDPRRYL